MVEDKEDEHSNSDPFMRCFSPKLITHQEKKGNRHKNIDVYKRQQLLCGSVSLVLLDINLPDGSGLDFLQELKAADPVRPVILLTANAVSYTHLDVYKRQPQRCFQRGNFLFGESLGPFFSRRLDPRARAE